MIQHLMELTEHAQSFRVRINFKGKWVGIDDIDYKSLPEDDLFEFYNGMIMASSQPRG